MVGLRSVVSWGGDLVVDSLLPGPPTSPQATIEGCWPERETGMTNLAFPVTIGVSAE